MYRTVVSCLIPAMAFAQGFAGLFEKAPPNIENDLRERITFFYQAHKDKKFRQADQVVHEESKDTFFAAEKVSFRDFKIVSISYEENYTRARAVVEIDTDFVTPGFGVMQVHRPLASFWKVDQGKWWWYVPQFDGAASPFGVRKGGPEVPSGVQQPPTAAEQFEKNRMTIEQLRAAVTVDRTAVTLQSHEPSEQSITIQNRFVGDVHLKLSHDDLPALNVKLEKEVLKPGESGRVFFRGTAKSSVKQPDGRAQITVEEIAKTINVQINFAYPPTKP